MVEYSAQLDMVFGSLADATRRDILRRVAGAQQQLTVSDIARHYDISLAAISKHLKTLEAARLVTKHRKGKQHLVSIAPGALKSASQYLAQYDSLWKGQITPLETLLLEERAGPE